MGELFCGVTGGLGLAFILASEKNEYKIKPIWANDIDKDTCETYSKNIHCVNTNNIVCAPVEEIDFTNIPDFDGLSFGFPAMISV